MILNKLRRKGDPTDLILFLVIIFFLVISIVIAIYTNTIVHSIISDTVLNSSSAYSAIDKAFTNINDYGVQRTFIFMFALFIIGILISSFLVRVHPVWMFIYIIFLALSIYVAVFLANSYATLVSNDLLLDIADKYQGMTWIMQHIVKILIGVGALSMIIIFGKIGGDSNNAQQDI